CPVERVSEPRVCANFEHCLSQRLGRTDLKETSVEAEHDKRSDVVFNLPQRSDHGGRSRAKERVGEATQVGRTAVLCDSGLACTEYRDVGVRQVKRGDLGGVQESVVSVVSGHEQARRARDKVPKQQSMGREVKNVVLWRKRDDAALLGRRANEQRSIREKL